MRHPLHSARRLVTLAAICLASLSFSLAAHANTPAAPPAPAAVASQNSTPAPGSPSAPPEPQAPAPAARREEEHAPVAAPAAPVAALPPSPMATRISAALSSLRGQGAIVQQLADRDNTISQLRLIISQRDQTIGTLNQELAQHRADHASLTASLAQLNGERSTVTSELASLGFPAAQLPAQTGAEATHVFDQWLCATGPEKRALWTANKAAIRAEANRRDLTV